MTAVLVALVVLIGLLVALAAASVRVLREYERAVVFRLGRLIGQRGPGLVLLIPGIDRMVRVSLRTVTLNIPPQNVITCDNVPAHVDAVAYFRVVDPNASVVEIEDAVKATSQIAQTTLRSVLGKADLDALLVRARAAQRGPAADHRRADRAVGDQGQHGRDQGRRHPDHDAAGDGAPGRGRARAPREGDPRRGRVPGRGKLSQAAGVLSQTPAAIQLRYLQTLSEIGAEQNSTIVFPLPIDLVKPLLAAGEAVAPKTPEGASSAGKGELPAGTGGGELPRGAATPAVRSRRPRDRAPR